jgi:glycerol-3-phosphate dehydrogenase
MAEPVAIIMAKALQKDEQWITEQVGTYTKLAEGYLLKG